MDIIACVEIISYKVNHVHYWFMSMKTIVMVGLVRYRDRGEL